jgi:hypothetical protein
MDNLSLSIIDRYPCTFLPTMLQGSESQREIVPYINALVVLLHIDTHYPAGIV